MSLENKNAVILATVSLPGDESGSAKPLEAIEWGRFAKWMKPQGLTPECLLGGSLKSLLRDWSDETVTVERLESLFGRRDVLSRALEKWESMGIWVLVHTDLDYPPYIKRRMRESFPPLLFGLGNKYLLKYESLAVVGSCDAPAEDTCYAWELGKLSATNGRCLVSSGDRGVTEAALMGSLENEGDAIVMQSHPLAWAAGSGKWRECLNDDWIALRLALVSPCCPEVGFSAEKAIEREKYIYCMSRAAFVIRSGTSGRTWSGATENLTKDWVPLWVKRTDDLAAGNALLAEKGAKWAPETISKLDFSSLFPSEEGYEKQHFVPQFLSIRFTIKNSGDRKELYCFDRNSPEKGVHKISLINLHKELNLYTQSGEHGCRDISIERFFSYLEGEAGKVVKKIINEARNGKVYQPDHCEKEVLVRFFFHQVGRTPDFANMILKRGAKKEKKDVESRRKEIGPEYMFRRENEKVLNILQEKNFAIVKIFDPKESFIIGSHPVLRLPPNPIYLSDTRVELWLPITPDVAVVLFSREIKKLLEIRDPHIIRKINEGIFRQSSAIAGCSRELLESLAGMRHRSSKT